MEWPVPQTLSPSSMGSFTNCPLAFRFSYVQRLPEPPSAPASRGTLVHRALELLLDRPADERTIDAALSDLDRAGAELAAHPEFSGLDLDPEALAAFQAEAAVLVRKYFELEDPRTVRPIGLEIKLAADLGKVTVRGVIDRLELDDNDDLVISDYKTGSSPSEFWEEKSLAGVHIYALLCEHNFKKLPARVQLLYLSKPEAIIATPSDGSVRAVRSKSNAVMDAVQRACSKNDFRPRPSALCDYCSFREFCPAYDGNPDDAAVVLRERAETAAGRPPLPFATV
jgi:putative RecB family exonuclease